MCNREALKFLARQEGRHETFVFAGVNGQHKDIKATGWRRGGERAADAFEQATGQEATEDFRALRVHDLRHTFATRLRRLGASNETRKDLLGHTHADVTTLYSQVEVMGYGVVWSCCAVTVRARIFCDSPQNPRKAITSNKEVCAESLIDMVATGGLEPPTPAL